MKISKKEYRKNWMKQRSKLINIFYFLFITQFKIEDSKLYDDNWDYTMRVRFLNPWNPLSYIVLIGLVIFYWLTKTVDDKITWIDFVQIFKYE